MKYLHVNSSLPRSGSELLQALLGQHPDVYASATSPLLEYWYGALGNFGMAEVRSQDPGLMKKAFAAFMRSGAHGYYEAITDRKVVVDKSRGWLQHAELLWDAFPDARVVCMVRPLKDIVASMERIYQAHNGHPETRKLPRTRDDRAKHWTSPGVPPLGLAIERMNDREAKGEDERILYVDYDRLVADPIVAMNLVFSHLALDPFEIDPDHVEKSAPEDDRHYGIFGDHKLHPVVKQQH